ncbi:MAG: L-threonylcarbamoyladenylate synthase [Candidatus Njordarchaeia archaeon]
MKVIKIEEVDRHWSEIVEVLDSGGVVALPTDTSYGLSVDAGNVDALNKLFFLKRRPRGKPVAIFLSSPDDVYDYGEVNRFLERVLHFLPLEITIITWAKKSFPEGFIVVDGKIGLRVPNHFLPRRIVEVYGWPVTATSANVSGEPEVYDPTELLNRFSGVDLVVDGGVLPRRPVSTVIDFTFDPPRVVREGFYSVGELEKMFGFSLD